MRVAQGIGLPAQNQASCAAPSLSILRDDRFDWPLNTVLVRYDTSTHKNLLAAFDIWLKTIGFVGNSPIGQEV